MDVNSSSAAPKVLLVDDDKGTRLLISSLLRRIGYQVTTAESGPDARFTIDGEGSFQFDAVVSDYWMPKENGLELLKSIVTDDPTLSVILMTANDERAILETLIKFGGCGFLQKPIQISELTDRMQSAVNRTKRLRHLQATEIEANTLGDNQRFLLQRQLNLKWPKIEFFFTSKSQASGDFVSAIQVNDTERILLASDASGHELSSAFQSNYFHGLARGMLNKGASIKEVFEYFNDALLTEWNDGDSIGHSLAACALSFDCEKSLITFLNAGFPRPVFSAADGFADMIGDELGASPLGWFNETFEMKTFGLSPGRYCMWTDGLSDLADSLEIDPLALAARLLQKHRCSDTILATSNDDIAVLRVFSPCSSANTSFMIPLVSIELAGSDVSNIDYWQTYVEASLRISIDNLDTNLLSEILVCTREALINALIHGCDRQSNKFATLKISSSLEGENISVQIQDNGGGYDFDWQSHAESAAENLIPAQRGLLMMQSIPTDIDISRNGSHVKMDFINSISNN